MRAEDATSEDPTADIRAKASDPSTSLAQAPTVVASEGKKTSLLVPDDDQQGSSAFLVLLDPAGACMWKQLISIGES